MKRQLKHKFYDYNNNECKTFYLCLQPHVCVVTLEHKVVTSDIITCVLFLHFQACQTLKVSTL